MKILHINSYYSGSKFYKNLYEYQVKNGLDISVFVPISYSINNQNEFGAYTTISNNHNKLDRFVFHIKQKKIYNDIINRYDLKEFSLIHAHSLFTNGYVAMKLKQNFKIPYIVAVRNTDVNIFLKKMIHLRGTGIQILKNADQIIFLSQPYRDEVIKRFVPESCKDEILRKTSVIPNGIDDYWFDNVVSQKSKPIISNLRLLQIGDVNKNKNIETTVKAIELLIKKKYKVRLDVVGKVKDHKVFNKIKDLNYVHYLGTKTKEELLDVYRSNDIFILPSINETFGLVYPEAMSQGLPVIYSKNQGFDGRFAEGEVGFSVNASNHVEISNRVLDILENYSSLSKNSFEKSVNFKWETINSKYYEIYKFIINNKR